MPNPISILTADKKWIPLKINDIEHKFGPLMLDSKNRTWCLLRRSDGVLVYDTKGSIKDTTDDVYKIFKIEVSEGEYKSDGDNINCIAEDNDGNIWVGTNLGPVIYSVNQDYFAAESPKASRIKVAYKNRNDNSAAYLLERDKINAIAIDGGNRKWIATATSGVYLLSADGTKEIQHFTEKNSPLLSDIVYDVAIDKNTNDVYFATENGLISYKSDAIDATDDFGKVYAYPNPVRPDFNGDITIVNLARNANVKITDVTGNLVFETTANGGIATWNGKTLSGNNINSGVYLIFCVNADGSKTYVTKLLYIR
jgi:ligand-binding sensor domain-containing protein